MGSANFPEGWKISTEDSQIEKDRGVGTPPTRTGYFRALVLLVFSWIMIGICFIYGFRMWQDAPIDPSFVPIVGASFAAALAFALVISFEITTGPIKFQAGSFNFEGASGPIIFWCICFFTIAMGLYFLGLPDAVKLPPSAGGKSVLELMKP